MYMELKLCMYVCGKDCVLAFRIRTLVRKRKIAFLFLWLNVEKFYVPSQSLSFPKVTGIID